MALLAGQRFVLFDKRIAGLAMIELLERRLPMNEREILAVMFEVAADAIPAIGILHSEKGVVALARGQPIRNFLVAFQAFERRRAGSELVAGIALCGAVQGFVRFGKRSRRNLSTSRSGNE